MCQQFWGYKVEWKSVSRGTGGKKVEYHWLTSSVATTEQEHTAHVVIEDEHR
jgi:hypothetical protein